MADPTTSDESAEKAYAEAAANKPVATPPAKPVVAPEPVQAKAAAPAPKAAKPKPAPKPAAKPAPKPIVRRKRAVTAKTKAPVARKPRVKKISPVADLSVTQLKDKIMATKTDFTDVMSKSMTDAVAEMQNKAKSAYDKGTGMVAEMTDLAKGNIEAVVESGKILATGMQDMGKTAAEDAKTVYETMTADMKEMAAVKSPTELFQLQGKIMRRNFDALIVATSKGSEASMKLANEAIAPLSARVTLAVEKLSKAA